MTKIIRTMAAVLLATIGFSVAPVHAADPATTTITVLDLECASCAKKVVAKLIAVPGVDKVEFDIPTRLVKVTHKAGSKPSPKSLWEAVENGGKDPSQLEDFGVKYTQKPKS